MTALRCIAAALIASAALPAAPEAPEEFRREFVTRHCVACHGTAQPKADFLIQPGSYDLSTDEQRARWKLALDYVAQDVMPPPKFPVQPSAEDRSRFVKMLQADLAASGGGQADGALLRRLNRIEYLNTLRDVFGIREIRLPPTFPAETTDLPFDTMSEGMYLTASHLDAYLEVATDVADRMVPLPNPKQVRTESTRATVGADPSRMVFWSRDGDEDGLYFTGLNIAPWSGGLWDKAFVAPTSGVYRVRINGHAEAAKGADGKPLRLGFYAYNPSDYDLPKRALRSTLPQVAFVEVSNLQPGVIEVDVPLEAGEKFHVYCENRLSKKYPDALLRTTGYTVDLRQLLKTYLEETRESAEPTIRWEHMTVEGPVAILPRQRTFLRDQTPSADRDYLASVLLPLAERTYRRPLTPTEQNDLVGAAVEHAAQAPVAAYGVHYGIRRILTSPQFLYRESGRGELDDYHLASRLSYFLWSTMPDEELLSLAASEKLGDALPAQVERMVADPRARQFVTHFTGQWLGNRKAGSVMVCDVKHVWSVLIRHGIVRATEMFFNEILQSNLSIRNFLDSDFTYANEPMRIAWGVPGNEVDLLRLEADQRQSLLWPEPERLDLTTLDDPEYPAHVRNRGGLLGLSGVMASTGDGVESSPILRGVWILDNLFGTPPPPPPPDVPALIADTSQAQTVREIIAAHQKVESCAVCHAKIDPFGLAMENYDASGGWRTAYYQEPDAEGEPLPVDAAATLPDGTRLEGPADIKSYALERPEMFTRGLTTKLLQYATGREDLSPAAEDGIRRIVAAEPAEGYGFRDLVSHIVGSETFRRR